MHNPPSHLLPRIEYTQQDGSALTAATVELDHILHNYRQIRGLVPESAEVLAVIKANGYGHGAVPVAQTLRRAGVGWFGVATVEEGIALRESGVTERIMVLSRLVPWNARLAVRWGLTPLVFNRELLDAYQQAARESRRPFSIHIKVDTGMGRLGVRPEHYAAFADEVARRSSLVVEGLCTNFSTADDLTDPYWERQMAQFREADRYFRSRFPKLSITHCANSATVLRAPTEASFDLVRPGLLLYGTSPLPSEATPISLKPALSLKTMIMHLQEQPGGAGISYGHTYVTPGPRRIATLPIGYRDGVNRHLSNRMQALVRGQRVPLVGNVCMDLVMADVTAVPGVSLYDEVVLIGRQGGQKITVDEVAAWAGTIPWEVYCDLGSRVERRYVSSQWDVTGFAAAGPASPGAERP